MRRRLTSLTDFLPPKFTFVASFLEQNSLALWTFIFKCHILPPPTEFWTKFFLINPPIFSTYLHIQFALPASWQGAHLIDISSLNTYSLWLRPSSRRKASKKPNHDASFPQQPDILEGFPISMECTPYQKQYRLSQQLCVFAHTAPDS